MNKSATVAAAILGLALLLPSVPAQSATDVDIGNRQGDQAPSAGTKAAPGTPRAPKGPPDCALARDPGRCEAMRAAHETCKDKRGADRQACLQAQDIHVDCSKARHPKRCEAREQAREACKGKKGPERRQCLRDAGAPQPPRP